MRATAILALLLTWSAPDLELEAEGLQAEAVEAGLRARVSHESLEDWSISVRSSDIRGQYDVRLQPPEGEAQTRAIVLEAKDDEGRSRELAAALSVIVDAWVRPEPEPEPEPDAQAEAAAKPEPEPHRVRGQALVGARLGMGNSPDLDLGAALSGGVEVLHGHLQPRVDVAWSRSREDELTLDGVRFGGGLAAGGEVHETVWLGAALTPRAMWVRAADRGEATTWTFNLEATAVLQFRVKRFLAEFRTGADIDGTPIRATGGSAQLRWGHLRWVNVLGVGLRI